MWITLSWVSFLCIFDPKLSLRTSTAYWRNRSAHPLWQGVDVMCVQIMETLPSHGAKCPGIRTSYSLMHVFLLLSLQGFYCVWHCLLPLYHCGFRNLFFVSVFCGFRWHCVIIIACENFTECALETPCPGFVLGQGFSIAPCHMSKSCAADFCAIVGRLVPFRLLDFPQLSAQLWHA